MYSDCLTYNWTQTALIGEAPCTGPGQRISSGGSRTPFQIKLIHFHEEF